MSLCLFSHLITLLSLSLVALGKFNIQNKAAGIRCGEEYFHNVSNQLQIEDLTSGDLSRARQRPNEPGSHRPSEMQITPRRL